MPSDALKQRTSQFAKEVLVPSGFGPVKPLSFERLRDNGELAQGFGIVRGTSDLQGMFTADVFWRFAKRPMAAVGLMDCRRRIGTLDTGSDQWFRVADDASWKRLHALFIHVAEPFLTKYGLLSEIIRDVETGNLNPEVAFGKDPGWRALNLGYCYMRLGNKQLAARHLNEVLEKHSSLPYEWAHRRTQAAKTLLQDLSG
jgi:hypothetical protein